jgi:protein SCO1/2
MMHLSKMQRRQQMKKAKTREMLLLASLILLIFSSVSFSLEASKAPDYALYDVKNPQQPIQVDCATKHAKYLPTISPDESTGLQQISMTMQNDEHQMHHNMMKARKSYHAELKHYSIPDVSLTSDKGETRRIQELLNGDKPVMLNFIFTTCTTICPVLSASFSQVQEMLGDESQEIAMISISIDPEFDTVEKLSRYSERFDAGDQWAFYTGQLNDVVAVQKAFDIYRGSKVNHEPITLLHAKGDPSWLRIDGLANASDIVAEYRKLLADGNQTNQ